MGGTISKLVNEDITYDEVFKNIDNLWNFLFFTGYLKKVSESVDYRERKIIEMKIPNKELVIVFENKIHEWFKNRYAAEWEDEGYTDIMKYGVAFYKKRCLIKKGA
jgi:hypothetical protein